MAPRSRDKRDLPIALVVSTLCHAVIGIALAWWLVPGQQSSLPSGDAPLAVSLRVEAQPPPQKSVGPETPPAPQEFPGQESATPAPQTPPALVAPGTVPLPSHSAPGSALQLPASSVAIPTPSRAGAAAPEAPTPAVATGTTTLAVDNTVSVNVAIDSFAARGLNLDVPVEVGNPVRVHTVPPIIYPPAALQGQREASILALVVVDERGMPYDISLLEFDKEFSDSAIEALKATRFTPAEDMNGVPIMFYTTIRLNFLASTPGSSATPGSTGGASRAADARPGATPN